MSTPADQQVGGPAPSSHRPWGWIVACMLLVLVAGGLAIWAFSLQSDLDDQREQTAQAQQEAQQASDEVGALSDQVDQITQTVSEAGDELAQAGSNVQANAEQALDRLNTELSALKDRVQQALDEAGASNP